MTERADPQVFHPASVFLSPFAEESIAEGTRGASASQPTTAANGVAQRAYYVPFRLRSPYVVQRFWWANGTTAATDKVQIGVYNAAGGAVVLSTAGGVLASGVSQPQFDATNCPFRLYPGLYYMAIWCNGTTTHILRINPATRFLRGAGVFQQSSLASGLPTTSATFAAGANAILYLYGITSRATP